MRKKAAQANAQAVPDHPDAAIFSLAEECVAAAKRVDETGAVFDKAEERCRLLETPAAIVMTERDRQLGLFVGNARVGATFGRNDIPVLRALIRTYNIVDDDVSVEIWKRTSEILEALRTLDEDEEREEIRSGLAEAKRTHYPAVDVHDDLVERLAKTPASTLEGALAKARAMRRTFLGQAEDFTERFNDNLRSRMRRVGPDQEACALSLARDMIALAEKSRDSRGEIANV